MIVIFYDFYYRYGGVTKLSDCPNKNTKSCFSLSHRKTFSPEIIYIHTVTLVSHIVGTMAN